jgi:hypothetical protein
MQSRRGTSCRGTSVAPRSLARSDQDGLDRDQVLLADAEELHKVLKRRVRQAQRADDELAAEDIIECVPFFAFQTDDTDDEQALPVKHRRRRR